jgi:photosystem II stability/assembly factor-like uncharacterized protein
VFRTDDGGETFVQLGDVAHSDLVSVDFTDPARNTLLSGTHEAPLVFRSTDGGQTWADVSAGLPEGIGQATAPHVIDAQTHLLGTKLGPAAAVYRTTDGGATWTAVHPKGINGAPVVVDGAIFWLLDGGAGLIKSTDDGATWTEIPGNGSIAPASGSLVALPDGRLATLGGGGVVVTADEGATWTQVGPPYPYGPSGLAYAPVGKAFYIWRFDCAAGDNPIPADAIMRVNFDYETG